MPRSAANIPPGRMAFLYSVQPFICTCIGVKFYYSLPHCCTSPSVTLALYRFKIQAPSQSHCIERGGRGFQFPLVISAFLYLGMTNGALNGSSDRRGIPHPSLEYILGTENPANQFAHHDGFCGRKCPSSEVLGLLALGEALCSILMPIPYFELRRSSECPSALPIRKHQICRNPTCEYNPRKIGFASDDVISAWLQ